MKIKTSELIDHALDWAVATARGTKPVYNWRAFGVKHYGAWETDPAFGSAVMLRPYSSDWAQGGPIIDREITKLFKNVGGTYTAQIKREIPIRPEDRRSSLASHYIDWCNVAGPTLLIAAMRCYVASKLGDEVEVPDELFR